MTLNFHSYMLNTITFSSPQAQEEVMKMYCHAVLRKLAADIIKNEFFSVLLMERRILMVWSRSQSVCDMLIQT